MHTAHRMCAKDLIYLVLLLKLFLTPRLVFLKDLTYLGSLYCGMLLMKVIALLLRGLWHAVKQDVTILSYNTKIFQVDTFSVAA